MPREAEEEEKGMPIIVGRCRRSRWAFAEVVPSKGRDPYAIKRVTQSLKALGYPRMDLKTDQEPAIMKLKEAVAKELRSDHGITMIDEESPVGEHKSNGEVENSVKRIQGMVRIHKDALEERIGERLGREDKKLNLNMEKPKTSSGLKKQNLLEDIQRI